MESAENDFQEEIKAIINERGFKRYFGYRSGFIYTERVLLTGDPFSIAVEFVISVITNKWPKKSMQSYLLRLLAIKQVAEEVRKWRSNTNDYNILHLACQYCRSQVIESIIENCGEDLIHEKSASNELPLFFLSLNKANSIKTSMKNVIEFFVKKTNDGETVLRQTLLDRKYHEECSISFISAFVERYGDLEDNSAIDSDVIMRILNYYSDDFSIWNRHKYLRICKAKLLRLLQRVSISHKASVVLLKKFDQPRYYLSARHWDCWNFYLGNYNTSRLRYFWTMSATQPELFTFVLTHVDHSRTIKFDYRKYKIQEVIEECWVVNNNRLRIDLILTMINTPEMFDSIRTWVYDSKVFKVPFIYTLIEKYDFYHRLTNADFKRRVLCTAMESYVNGVTFPTEGTGDIEKATVEFPVADLPTDLICVVMSFLPYQQLLAFSMTCKQCHCIMQDSHVVWQKKFDEGFPFDAKPKEFTRQSFVSRYKNKFAIGPPEKIRFSQKPLETDRGYYNVHQNIVTYTNDDKITIYDFETMNSVQITATGKLTRRTSRFLDCMYVTSEIGFEVYSLYDYKPLGVLNIFELKENNIFDVNDKWLVTGQQIFDVTTGKLLAESEELMPQQSENTVILRGDIAMRVVDNGSCEVMDLRTNLMDPVVLRPHAGSGESRWRETTQINASYNYIYLSNDYVEIMDLRNTSQPVWISPLAMNDSRPVIDLVSMNVWGRGFGVWDLVNYKWAMPERQIAFLDNMRGRWYKCNGKHLIYLKSSKCWKVDFAGSEYFPLSS